MRIVKSAVVVCFFAALFSINCNASENRKEKDIAIVEEVNKPRADFWTYINTTSGSVIIPIGTYVPGASSYYVRLLQCSLNSLGYNCGNVDGIYGNNTKICVINFQKNRGLTADGIVGESTWRQISYNLKEEGIKVSFSK